MIKCLSNCSDMMFNPFMSESTCIQWHYIIIILNLNNTSNITEIIHTMCRYVLITAYPESDSQ